MQNQQNLQRAMFVPTIVWGALMFSQLIYLFVGYIQLKARGDIPFDPSQFSINIFMIIGFIWAGLAFPLSNFILRASVKHKKAEFLAENVTLQKVIASYFIAMVLKLALIESCAIFGLIQTFLLKSWVDQLVSTVVALGLFAISRPTAEEIENTFRDIVGPTFRMPTQ